MGDGIPFPLKFRFQRRLHGSLHTIGDRIRLRYLHRSDWLETAIIGWSTRSLTFYILLIFPRIALSRLSMTCFTWHTKPD